MQRHAGSFDFILDAVSADHDINASINLLRRDCNITLVGAPEKPLAVSAFGLIMEFQRAPAHREMYLAHFCCQVKFKANQNAPREQISNRLVSALRQTNPY